MHALTIPYDTIHICMHRGSCVGHRLERVANMIIIFIELVSMRILIIVNSNKNDNQASLCFQTYLNNY